MEYRICRRCLLEKADEKLYQTVAEYIRSLGEDVRAKPDVYKSRLAACKECSHLISGTCVLCGCFVQARAAKAAAGCPALPAKW